MLRKFQSMSLRNPKHELEKMSKKIIFGLVARTSSLAAGGALFDVISYLDPYKSYYLRIISINLPDLVPFLAFSFF